MSDNIEVIQEKIWDGENGLKIPDLDILYIVDMEAAKLSDVPVSLDNDLVSSRKTDLMLLDKIEYEESVTNMITHYVKLVESLLSIVNDKGKPKAKKEVLEKTIFDNALNRIRV